MSSFRVFTTVLAGIHSVVHVSKAMVLGPLGQNSPGVAGCPGPNLVLPTWNAAGTISNASRRSLGDREVVRKDLCAYAAVADEPALLIEHRLAADPELQH